MKKLLIEPRFDIAPAEEPGQIVAFGVGPDLSVYTVLALRVLDTRDKRPTGAVFFKTKPDKRQAYKVKIWSPLSRLEELIVADEEFNITAVQPLGNDILLVSPRCLRQSEHEIELNGRVVGRDGRFKRAFVLGDGIESVQVAPDLTVWASYFDEGIFGNFGWDYPLGASGLVQWSSNGDKLYEFTPPNGVDTISDCYAMNVDPDGDVWCYYYTEFPLVQLRGNKVRQTWQPAISGSHCFAVQPPFVLFFGNYDNKQEVTLMELLHEGRTKTVGKFLACTAEGQPISVDRTDARGAVIHMLSGRRLYKIDIDTVLKAG